MTANTERAAIMQDAHTRLGELIAVRDVLMPDRDDPEVLSELTMVESQITCAERALAAQRPWTLIEADDPTIRLGEGRMSDWPTLTAAAGQFARSTAPYKQVIYDNDIEARELNDQEQKTLEFICHLYGLDVETINN
jgi:hypothetical protein